MQGLYKLNIKYFVTTQVVMLTVSRWNRDWLPYLHAGLYLSFSNLEPWTLELWTWV